MVKPFYRKARSKKRKEKERKKLKNNNIVMETAIALNLPFFIGSSEFST